MFFSILINLSLPVECLSPIEDALLTTKIQNIRKQLLLASFEIKKAFLNDASTSPIVAMLREAMIKSVSFTSISDTLLI